MCEGMQNEYPINVRKMHDKLNCRHALFINTC